MLNSLHIFHLILTRVINSFLLSVVNLARRRRVMGGWETQWERNNLASGPKNRNKIAGAGALIHRTEYSF